MDKKQLELEQKFLNAMHSEDKDKAMSLMNELMKCICKKCQTAVSGVSPVTAPFILAALQSECEMIKGLFAGVEAVADEIQKTIGTVAVEQRRTF